MGVMERLAQAGIVPVVVLEKVEDAVPTAEALLADHDKIASMEREILKLGKKRAAKDIADEVLKLCK